MLPRRRRLVRLRSSAIATVGLVVALALGRPVLAIGVENSTSAKDGFRVCRTRSMVFPQATSTNTSVGNQVFISIQYRCGGDAYDRFTVQMEDYALHKYDAPRSSSMWGRREFPLPDNVTVLAIGNSHLRQTMLSLLCQYEHQISGVRVFLFPDVPIHEFLFVNSASLVLSYNSPLVYSNRWGELLRKYDPLDRPLEAYNAIVVGKFNRYGTSHKWMNAIEAKYRDEVNLSIPPPTLDDVARLFSKAVVALPPFALYGLSWEDASRATRSSLPASRRSTIVVLHGRKHIDEIGQECATQSMDDSGGCYNKGDSNPYGRDPADMHRCTGPRGGHPDLLAWDVMETLYDLLGRQKRALRSGVR